VVNEREFADGARIVAVEHADGATELILQLDGQKVSRTVVVPMLMRVGVAVVRMDGIGGVGTEEPYRNRGYSRRVLESAVEKMRAGNAALSTLYGIEDFYPKFGFATIGPEYTVTLPLREPAAATASLPPGWNVRPFAGGDLPAVRRLYHLNTKRATGALVRHDEGDELAGNASLAQASPAARRIGRRAWGRLEKVGSAPGKDECRVVIDRSGAVAAYAWLGRQNWWMGVRGREAPTSFHVAEAMAIDPTAADAVLAACRLWAAEGGGDLDQVDLAIPPEGPVAGAAAYEGGSVHVVHSRCGEFMGRVLNVDRLLAQMQPEFSERVRACRVPFRGELVLKTDEGEGSLFVTADGVSLDGDAGGARLSVELPQHALARLCLGGFETGDLLRRLPSPPDRQTEDLLRVLFPRRLPHIYPIDRF
jgi:predicted N-acetyltransferase YhbS